MKRILAGVIFLFSTVLCFSQAADDSFSSYEEMVGKDVMVYGLNALFSQNGAFIYVMTNDKLKVIKDPEYYAEHDVAPIKVKEVFQIKKKTYLKCFLIYSDVYLLVNNKIKLLQASRSKTYWDDKLSDYSKLYGYVKYPSYFSSKNDAIASMHLGKYVPLRWESVLMPDDYSGDVFYNCVIGGEKKLLSEDIIDQHKDDIVSLNDYYSVKRAHDEAVAAEQRRIEAEESRRDSTLVCEAIIRHTSSAQASLEKADIPYDEKDTLWLSIYASKDVESGYGSLKKKTHCYEGFLFGEPMVFPDSDLSFEYDSLSREARAFIDRRGYSDKGIEARKNLAIKNDKMRSASHLEKQRKRLEQIESALAKIENFRKQKKIFIIEQKYSYSDYQFGLEFKFFNCYNKVIKYVEIKTNAYNQVGDLQGDYFGYSSKTVRCIGPIEKEETAVFDFDKMFWDENDVIHHLTVVDVKITFMDGTVTRYSGKDNVKLHTSDYYSAEQKKILKDMGIEL